jgi:hypothetical protein
MIPDEHSCKIQPLQYIQVLISSYCIKELQRDIELQLAAVKDESERERLRAETQLGIFVVHNKSVQSLLMGYEVRPKD